MSGNSIRSPKSVALFIDGENISASFADSLIPQAERYGTLIVKRVYGNAARMNGWCESPGYRVIHSGVGKNAADILLAIEAVDLAHLDRIDLFVIVSSDGDFCHLAHRLRESGHEVIGLGLDKAPESFRRACSAFHVLDSPQAKEPKLTELDEKIHAVINSNSKIHRLPVTSLNALMRKKYNVKISELPQKTWRKYLKSKPDLYRCDEKGPDASVELLTRRPCGICRL